MVSRAAKSLITLTEAAVTRMKFIYSKKPEAAVNHYPHNCSNFLNSVWRGRDVWELATR